MLNPRRARWSASIAVTLAASLFVIATGAAEEGDKSAALRPPATAPAAAANPDDTIIAQVDFNNVSLDDMIAYLQETVPHFKAVVFRDAGVGPDVPTVSIRLKGVSLGQVMQVLVSAYPYVEFQPIEGAGGTIQLIKVHALTPDGVAVGGAGLGGAPGLSGNPAVGLAGGAQVMAASVKVFSLTDVVDRLATRRPDAAKDIAAARKAGLEDVLSLIKATLSQAGDAGAPPSLQLHEETQTLIFKGNPLQRAAVDDVLSSLTPRVNESVEHQKAEIDRLAADYHNRLSQSEDRMQELHKQLADTIDELRKREQLNAQQAVEIERLKVRMEEMARQRDAAVERSGAAQRQPAGKQ
jgi:hypothetical protein